MSKKIDKVRAAETALVTDKVLEEIGIGASEPPPLPLLKDLVREVAEENDIELTEHEVDYVAITNIGWVYRDTSIKPNFNGPGVDISETKQ